MEISSLQCQNINSNAIGFQLFSRKQYASILMLKIPNMFNCNTFVSLTLSKYTPHFKTQI